MWAFFSFSFQFAFTRLGEGIECEAKQKEKRGGWVGGLGRGERPGWLQGFLTISQAALDLGGSWGATAGE